MILYEKAPVEKQDYDTDFNPWLTGLSDTALSLNVEYTPGITLNSFTLASGIVKLWISGGLDKKDYTFKIILTTTGGRVKCEKIVISVRE